MRIVNEPKAVEVEVVLLAAGFDPKSFTVDSNGTDSILIYHEDAAFEADGWRVPAAEVPTQAMIAALNAAGIPAAFILERGEGCYAAVPISIPA